MSQIRCLSCFSDGMLHLIHNDWLAACESEPEHIQYVGLCLSHSTYTIFSVVYDDQCSTLNGGPGKQLRQHDSTRLCQDEAVRVIVGTKV